MTHPTVSRVGARAKPSHTLATISHKTCMISTGKTLKYINYKVFLLLQANTQQTLYIVIPAINFHIVCSLHPFITGHGTKHLVISDHPYKTLNQTP